MELLNPVHPSGQDIEFIIKGVQAPVLHTLTDSNQNVILHDIKLLNEQDGDAFILKLNAEKAIPGIYKMHIVDGKSSKVFHMTLTTKVSMKEVIIQDHLIPFGKKLPSTFHLSEFSGDIFTVQGRLMNEFSNEPIDAHQAFIHFKSNQHGKEIFYHLPIDEETKTHKISIDTTSQSKRFSHQSGLYHVYFTFGSPSFENSIHWEIGMVNFTFRQGPVAPSIPLYSKPLLHESDTTLKALSEITHLFHPPASRPSISISIIFTAIVLLPLIGFLIYLIGFHHINFIFDINSIWAIGFFISIASILGLYVLYWLELSMFTTLGYLSILLPMTFLLGHHTLSSIHEKKN